jgi:hypothetical protein
MAAERNQTNPRETRHTPSTADGASEPKSQDIRSTADSATLAALLEVAAEDRASAAAAAPWAMTLSDADRRRLIAVARATGPLKLDAADVSALVQAVLPGALAAMAADDLSRNRLVQRIAGSLLEDPQSRERLQALIGALNAVKVAQAEGPDTAAAREG